MFIKDKSISWLDDVNNKTNFIKEYSYQFL